MGKGDKRGKTKTPPPGIPALAAVHGSAKQARDRGRFVKQAEDAPRVALTARCLRFGITPTQDARRALSGQHAGSQLGMVMMRECEAPEELARLWTCWQGFCAAERTYRLRYMGQSGDPKGASIAVPTDRMETDQHHTVDVRTPDQKDRDAVNNWMRWRGYVGHLSAREATALHEAERENGKPVWEDRRPTAHGLAAYRALVALADVVEKAGKKSTG